MAVMFYDGNDYWKLDTTFLNTRTGISLNGGIRDHGRDENYILVETNNELASPVRYYNGDKEYAIRGSKKNIISSSYTYKWRTPDLLLLIITEEESNGIKYEYIYVVVEKSAVTKTDYGYSYLELKGSVEWHFDIDGKFMSKTFISSSSCGCNCNCNCNSNCDVCAGGDDDDDDDEPDVENVSQPTKEDSFDNSSNPPESDASPEGCNITAESSEWNPNTNQYETTWSDGSKTTLDNPFGDANHTPSNTSCRTEPDGTVTITVGNTGESYTQQTSHPESETCNEPCNCDCDGCNCDGGCNSNTCNEEDWTGPGCWDCDCDNGCDCGNSCNCDESVCDENGCWDCD